MSQAISISTSRTYRQVWKLLKKLCQEIHSPNLGTPPIPPSLVFLFLTSQVARGIAGKSLSTYCSAISYVHKLQGLPDSTTSVAIKKLLIGARKQNPSSDIRLPITTSILKQLVVVLPSLLKSNYDILLYTALFLVCFHGCFRIGELLPKSQSQASLVLQFDCLKFLGSKTKIQGISFTIKHSKNQEPGMLTKVTLHCRDFLCPVKAMQKYLVARGTTLGPIFCWTGGVPLIRSHFDNTLRLAVQVCNLKGKYVGHSFRIGAATEAAAQGQSDAQIRKLGRWRSNAFLSYIRQHISQ